MAFTSDNASNDYRCKSTDTKPTDGVQVNDSCLEMDTGDVYYFNGTEWTIGFGG